MVTLSIRSGFGQWLSRWSDKFYWHLVRAENGGTVTACDIGWTFLRASFKFGLVAFLIAVAGFGVVNQLAFISMPVFGVVHWHTMWVVLCTPNELKYNGPLVFDTRFVMTGLIAASALLMSSIEIIIAVFFFFFTVMEFVLTPLWKIISGLGDRALGIAGVAAEATTPTIVAVWYQQFKEKTCIPVKLTTESMTSDDGR